MDYWMVRGSELSSVVWTAKDSGHPDGAFWDEIRRNLEPYPTLGYCNIHAHQNLYASGRR